MLWNIIHEKYMYTFMKSFSMTNEVKRTPLRTISILKLPTKTKHKVIIHDEYLL